MCTWFKHDSLAHKDKKLQRLMHDHGYTGYGMYFSILEWMTYDKDHYLDNDVRFVCRLLGERGKKPEAIVSDILYKYGLFVFTEDEREFTSERLQRSLPDTARASERTPESEATTEEDSTLTSESEAPQAKRKYSLSEEGRQSLRKSIGNARKCKTNPNEQSLQIPTGQNQIPTNPNEQSLQIPTGQNQIPTQSQESNPYAIPTGQNQIPTNPNEQSLHNPYENGGNIRGEEEREENKELRDKEEESVGGSRGTKRTAFVPPSLQDVKERCEAMGYKHVSAERFYDYYESIGWLVGGKAKMKKWENALANWESREKTSAPTAHRGIAPTTRPTGLLNQGISRNDPRLAHLSKPPTAKPQANE